MKVSKLVVKLKCNFSMSYVKSQTLFLLTAVYTYVHWVPIGVERNEGIVCLSDTTCSLRWPNQLYIQYFLQKLVTFHKLLLLENSMTLCFEIDYFKAYGRIG